MGLPLLLIPTQLLIPLLLLMVSLELHPPHVKADSLMPLAADPNPATTLAGESRA